MPGESHGQRSLGATVHRVAELDTTEQQTLSGTVIIPYFIKEKREAQRGRVSCMRIQEDSNL